MKPVEVARSSKRGKAKPAENGGLFGWTVFILLLCGFAVACWIGTFYVFSHPEQGFSYRLLAKLHKLDPPRRFELTAAPPGEFVGPDKLLERYGAMSAGQLTEESDRLNRAFLRNYDHQSSKVPYVVGKFTVLDSYPMDAARYFPAGVVVVAQSNEIPNVFIEHVFPAEKEHLPAMQRILATGLSIELRRSYDLSAVIHVATLGDGRLLFTCMPLLYGPYGTTQNGSGFSLDPPKTLNVKAGLPVVTRPEMADGERRLAEWQHAMGAKLASAPNAADKTAKPLTGVVPPSPTPGAPASLAKDSRPAATPSTAGPALVQVARALPVNTQAAVPLAGFGTRPGTSPAPPALAGPAAAARSPSPSPTPVAVAVASPPPEAAVVILPRPTPPAVTVAATVAPGLPQPVLTTSPPPDTTSRVGSWPTYRAGQMPRGRLLDVEQTSEMADRAVSAEPMYLRGEFSVTAARENRAVLRPRQSLAERVLNRGNARIIVEYPRGLPTPHEGESFQRGPERPFQVVDIRRGADGQVNIYVREVTAP